MVVSKSRGFGLSVPAHDVVGAQDFLPRPPARAHLSGVARKLESMSSGQFANWEDARRVQFSEFEACVRKYDPMSVLIAMARVSASMPEAEGFQATWANVAPWTVSAIARQAILSSGRFGTRRPLDDAGFRRLLNLFRGVDVTPHTGFEFHQFLVGAAHEQFSYSVSVKEEVARTLAVLLDTPAARPDSLSESDLSNLVGAPIRDLASSTFVLWASARANHGIVQRETMRTLAREAPGNVPAAESLLATLDRLTATLDEARADGLAAPQFKGGLRKYAYNPLTRTPFIRVDEETVVAPQTAFVLGSCSLEAVYYLGQRAKIPNFGSDLGLRVEAYTGRQLRHTGQLDVHPEISWSDKKSIDWFVVTPAATILVECKSAHSTLEIRAGSPTTAEDTTAKLGPAIQQINRTVSQIRNHNPKFAHIPADRPFVGVIVTAEPIYGANDQEVRELMPEPVAPTITIALRELESISTLDPDSLGNALLRIASDATLSTYEPFSALKSVLGDYRIDRPNALVDEAFKRHIMPAAN